MEDSEENAGIAARIITDLFRRLRADPPFTSSLFAFVPRILNATILRPALLADFAGKFLEVTAGFLRKIYFRKLMAAAPALAGLTAICRGEQRRAAFGLLAPFFVCEFPVVREKAATELANAFENAKFCDTDEQEDEFDDTQLQAVLAETKWKDDFDGCASGLAAMCGMFAVDVPRIEKKEVQQQKRTFNYGNLVKDAV
jgi:hypothetical protein